MDDSSDDDIDAQQPAQQPLPAQQAQQALPPPPLQIVRDFQSFKDVYKNEAFEHPEFRAMMGQLELGDKKLFTMMETVLRAAVGNGIPVSQLQLMQPHLLINPAVFLENLNVLFSLHLPQAVATNSTHKYPDPTRICAKPIFQMTSTVASGSMLSVSVRAEDQDRSAFEKKESSVELMQLIHTIKNQFELLGPNHTFDELDAITNAAIDAIDADVTFADLMALSVVDSSNHRNHAHNMRVEETAHKYIIPMAVGIKAWYDHIYQDCERCRTDFFNAVPLGGLKDKLMWMSNVGLRQHRSFVDISTGQRHESRQKTTKELQYKNAPLYVLPVDKLDVHAVQYAPKVPGFAGLMQYLPGQGAAIQVGPGAAIPVGPGGGGIII